jgi:sugar/nucleoside kinase (ribokinase family)
MDDENGLDITGIGNAIVDIFSHEDDAFLHSHGMPKGSMNLIDAAGADELYGHLRPTMEMSGGSCANTIFCAASFGSSVAYIGKVDDDTFGDTFSRDIRAAGVHYQTPLSAQGKGTARSLIVVSPDGQRTMNTYLGACTELARGDIEDDLVRRAKVTYIEGYLYDAPHAKEAIDAAIAIAHDAGRKVALTLSDSYCVDRHRDEFRSVVSDGLDILFANEQEIGALLQTEALEETLDQARDLPGIVVITRSEKGSLICVDGTVHDVRAESAPNIVDTTGAGDAYAAGFLHGLTSGRDLPECGRLGSVAAAEIISHVGSRPQISLAELYANMTATPSATVMD